MRAFQVYINDEIVKKYQIPFCAVIVKEQDMLSARESIETYLKDTYNIQDDENVDLCPMGELIEYDETKVTSKEFASKYDKINH
jgi:uncharacterized protein (DUF1919 family)